MAGQYDDAVLQAWVDAVRNNGVKNSMNKFVGDGVKTVYDINFAGGYINKADILAYKVSPTNAKSDVTVTAVNDNKVTIDAPVESGWTLVIYRDTPKSFPLVDFADNSIINEKNLDTNFKQTVFGVAELLDRFDETVTFTLDAYAAAERANDSATAAATSATNASAAAASATQSAATASAASASAVAANTSATAAASQVAANASTASSAATTAVQAASTASTAATTASGAATTATTGASTATTKAAAAAASAVAAAASATSAAQSAASVNPAKLDMKGIKSLYDYAPTIKADGVTDDSAAVAAAIAAAPEGSTLRVSGLVRLAQPLVITRRIGLWCESATDGFLIDVGLGNTGVEYRGPAAGINEVNIQLNLYGRANCADHALILGRVDRSPHIYVNVYAGTAQEAVLLSGCLINVIGINSSANFQPPYAGMAFQAKHVRLTKMLGVATNANLIWVNLEGGGAGLYSDNMVSEGNNTIYGTIEGLVSGRPIELVGCLGAVVRDLHFEANALGPRFVDCSFTTLGPGVLNPQEGKPAVFENCRQPKIDGYYGEYVMDNLCSSPIIGRVMAMSYNSLGTDSYFESSEVVSAPVWVGSADAIYGGPGSFSLENLFPNPYMDIWDNGPSAAPAGCTTAGSVTVDEIAYPLPVYTHPEGRSCRVTVSSTGTTEGLVMKCAPPHDLGRQSGHFVAVTVPVYVASGQPDVIVFIFASGQFFDIGRVSAKDKWTVVRGAARCAAGQPVQVYVRPWNFSGGGGVAGQFYVGGCTIVKGTRASKFLADHGKRIAHIVDNVSWHPAFVGQEAYVPGTGKWYKAKGTSSSADWVPLN